MSDFQPPLINPLPMPAPAAPIVTRQLPEMPRLSAPTAEATMGAHIDMVEDLELDAEARAKLGLGGANASMAARLQYGTPDNGAMLYGERQPDGRHVWWRAPRADR